VDGGMEDWLYAEGWDPEGLKKECTGFQSKIILNQTTEQLPTFNNPLNSSNSHLNPFLHARPRLRKIRNLDNSALQAIEKRDRRNRRRLASETASGNRAMVFLVETSDLKKPRQDSLGGSTNVSFLFVSFLCSFLPFLSFPLRFFIHLLPRMVIFHEMFD
jgi:hypothetical protein